MCIGRRQDGFVCDEFLRWIEEHLAMQAIIGCGSFSVAIGPGVHGLSFAGVFKRDFYRVATLQIVQSQLCCWGSPDNNINASGIRTSGCALSHQGDDVRRIRVALAIEEVLGSICVGRVSISEHPQLIAVGVDGGVAQLNKRWRARCFRRFNRSSDLRVNRMGQCCHCRTTEISENVLCQ